MFFFSRIVTISTRFIVFYISRRIINILFILRRCNTRAVLDCICLYSVYRYAAAGSSRVEDKFVVVPIEATTFAMSQCGKKREEEREEATKGGRQ